MTQNINERLNSHFQIILLEHATPDYWEGELNHFNTNYVFVEDKDYGLIPNYVDNGNN